MAFAVCAVLGACATTPPERPRGARPAGRLGYDRSDSAFYGAVSQITRALDVKLEANAGQTAYGAC